VLISPQILHQNSGGSGGSPAISSKVFRMAVTRRQSSRKQSYSGGQSSKV
jgi:hypothetical protein